MTGKKRVLIVDDDEDFCALASVRLEEGGLEVHTDSEGNHLVEKVKQVKPDLIVLDVMLAHLDGLTLFKQMKREGIQVPVVVVTGKAVMMKEVFEMEGAKGFFQKPVDLKAFVKYLKGLVGE